MGVMARSHALTRLVHQMSHFLGKLQTDIQHRVESCLHFVSIRKFPSLIVYHPVLYRSWKPYTKIAPLMPSGQRREA